MNFLVVKRNFTTIFINNLNLKNYVRGKMRITISGPPGSGKGTVSKILAKHYHLKFYSVGDLRREAARKKGMTIEKFNKWSEKHPEKGDEYFD